MCWLVVKPIRRRGARYRGACRETVRRPPGGAYQSGWSRITPPHALLRTSVQARTRTKDVTTRQLQVPLEISSKVLPLRSNRAPPQKQGARGERFLRSLDAV